MRWIIITLAILVTAAILVASFLGSWFWALSARYFDGVLGGEDQ